MERGIFVPMMIPAFPDNPCAGGGSGTVTSVGITAPAMFAVANSPITTSGTIALTLTTQQKSHVLIGPVANPPAAPTFRNLVADDIATGSAGPTHVLRGNMTWGNETVTSVNTQTGAVNLTAANVGAAATVHTHAASDIISGVIATARLASSGTADATTFLRGDQTWATPLGLTGFIASQNTAAPNNTVNASRLLVDAASTNADAVVQPKGTGSILAQLPDNLTSGGNKRGINAVDLQTSRTSATHVAAAPYSVISGGRNNWMQTYSDNSFIGGGSANRTQNLNCGIVGGSNNNVAISYGFIGCGSNNTVDAAYAAVCSGTGNLAQGNYGFVGAGQTNSVTGGHAVVCGGLTNNAAGPYSTISGGQSNTASANSSVIGGGSTNTVNPNYGVIAGGFSNTIGSSAAYGVCGGGNSNTVGGSQSFIGGGQLNTCSVAGSNSVVSGGTSNQSTATYGVICGGQSNQVQQAHAVVSGGSANVANGNHSAISGGTGNTTSGQYTAIIGGNNSQASGLNSAVLGGRENLASGDYSTVLGYHSRSYNYGSLAHASGGFASVVGSCQKEQYVQRTITTTNTQTELTQDGQAAGVNPAASMRIENDSTYAFSILVTARRADADNESAAWKFEGCIDNNAGTTAFVGIPITTILGDDSGGVWQVVVAADNVNDRLTVLVTGENTKTIRWAASATLIKVTG